MHQLYFWLCMYIAPIHVLCDAIDLYLHVILLYKDYKQSLDPDAKLCLCLTHIRLSSANGFVWIRNEWKCYISIKLCENGIFTFHKEYQFLAMFCTRSKDLSAITLIEVI